MPQLTIDFRYGKDPSLKLAGLSFKALGGSIIEHYIYRNDDGLYTLDSRFKINGRTARVEEEYLIKSLAEIREYIPFDSIKVLGVYQLTGEEILKRVIEHENKG